MSYPEAVMQLANECGIDTSNIDSKKFTDSKVKRKIEVSESYSQKISGVNYSVPVTDYFQRNKVNEELLRNVYGLTTSDNEVFFNHLEININNQWVSCFTKRRKIDGSMYQLPNNKGGNDEVKEITIAGGNVCFYGLASLYNSQGLPKTRAIVLEGQTDCHRTATEMHNSGQFDQFAILSVPTGSKTLKTAYNESPTFRKWYKKNCEFLILIPDADNAGLEMVEKAVEVFNGDEKVKWCDITQLRGIDFKEKKGQDITDAFNLGYGFKDLFSIADYLPMAQCFNPKSVKIEKVENFLWSGFATHDYNDTGLKAGKVTIITGIRGSGKTTLAGQMSIAVTQQNHKVFCYFGETPMSEVIETFTHMTTANELIEEMENGAGRKIFTPSEKAVNMFKKSYSNKILFYEDDQKSEINKYDLMKDKMIRAVKRGYKLFVLDNLMVLTIKRQSAKFFNKFDEQIRIMDDLKQFAKDNGVHIAMLAHPNAGGEKVSGAMEIENLADTILMYRRLDEQTAIAMSQIYNIPEHEAKKISAVVTNEKVRNHGTSYPMFLEWDGKHGMVIDVAYKEDSIKTADKYNKKNWFSRSINKHSEAYEPPKIPVTTITNN
jgi:KaiC/GvpD/RAD55 family RecA-like ATPase